MDEITAYFAGLVASDGHMARKRLSIELSTRDSDILYKLQRHFTKAKVRSRERNIIAFGDRHYIHKSVIFELHDVAFISSFSAQFNIPMRKKSRILEFPVIPEEYERHYIRGLIDGDGSLGFTGQGRPFVSLITASTAFAHQYCDFLKKTTGITKTTSPNKRDKAHNIVVYSDTAQKLATYLYQSAAISLDRKYAIAKQLMEWKREGRKECHPRRWTADEDKTIMSKSIQEAQRILGRTEKSIKIRKWRLMKTFTPIPTMFPL